MYIPKQFEVTDLSTLHKLISDHPLGTWVTIADGNLEANHIPFVIDVGNGPLGTLQCHVARSNPVWQTISHQLPSLVIFSGPNAYVSPTWYPSKSEHGRVVPTWNYAVVHVSGRPRVVDEPKWILEHVSLLTETHESRRANPWSVKDAPESFLNGLTQAIVGIEISIDSIKGKWKVSQNRSEADRDGVALALSHQSNSAAKEMAELVERHSPRIVKP
jgi:transcriptional regulator